MTNEERAEMLLEALGKELYKSAGEYMTSAPFSAESQAENTERKALPFRKRPFFLALRRGLVAILIIGVCLTGFVPEVRAAVIGIFNYFIEIFADHVRIEPEDNGLGEDSSTESWAPTYELGWIPENYNLFYQDSSDILSEYMYIPVWNDSVGFTFRQQQSSTFSILIDNERTVHEITEVNGFEARLFYELYPDVPDEPDSLCYGVILIWQEGDTTIMLNALDMSRADIFRIAEGVRKIR